MIVETKHCLRNLTNFTGRDARQTFWFYVLALVLAQFVLGMVLVVPAMVGMMGAAFSVAQSGAPPEEVSAAIMGQMGPMMRQQMLVGAVSSVIMGALFAAAFVRRLHDSDKPGWIVLVPLVTTVVAQVLAYSQIDEMMAMMQTAVAQAGQQQDMTQVMAMSQQMRGTSAMSLIGWVGYLVVIVCGVLPSTPGPNRYGDAPAQV